MRKFNHSLILNGAKELLNLEFCFPDLLTLGLAYYFKQQSINKSFGLRGGWHWLELIICRVEFIGI